MQKRVRQDTEDTIEEDVMKKGKEKENSQHRMYSIADCQDKVYNAFQLKNSFTVRCTSIFATARRFQFLLSIALIIVAKC